MLTRGIDLQPAIEKPILISGSAFCICAYPSQACCGALTTGRGLHSIFAG